MARLAAKGGLRKRWISSGLDDADGLTIENIRSGGVCNPGLQDRACAIEYEIDPRLAFRPAQAILDGIRNDGAGIDIRPQGSRVLCLEGACGRLIRSRRRLRLRILRRVGQIVHGRRLGGFRHQRQRRRRHLLRRRPPFLWTGRGLGGCGAGGSGTRGAGGAGSGASSSLYGRIIHCRFMGPFSSLTIAAAITADREHQRQRVAHAFGRWPTQSVTSPWS